MIFMKSFLFKMLAGNIDIEKEIVGMTIFADVQSVRKREEDEYINS